MTAFTVIASLAAPFETEGAGTFLDFNGNGRSDFAVYHPSGGAWYIQDGFTDAVLAWALPHGFAGAECLSGDFNGDSEADLAVYHPATGRWYIRTLGGQILAWALPWGFPTGEAVVADFNGDGPDDLGIYDRATGRWYVRTLGGTIVYWSYPWGYPGAEPLAGTYSGTAAEPTVFDDKLARFWIPNRLPRNVFNFDSEAEPLAGDFDGDNLTDLTTFDPSVSFWQLWVNDFLTDFISWGFAGGIPLAGDYNGDTLSDFAVYAKGSWFIRDGSNNILRWNHTWGAAGLVPVGRRMANPGVDGSALRFSDASAPFNPVYIGIENLEDGTFRTAGANSATTVLPGWHRINVIWYGARFVNGVEYFLPGTNSYLVSVEPGRTYQYTLSGGSINPPKAVAPTAVFTEN